MKRTGPKTVSLRALFSDLQAEMLAAFKVKRGNSAHAGVTGNSTEERWAKWLERYLPSRYQVKHSAIVVDSRGAASEQQDVVIFDRQYTPFLFHEDGAVHIPAEGVYAVLEVKQDISSAHIGYASNKVASVRRLYRTSGKIPHAGGTYKPKKPPRILGGLLAGESSWKNGTLANHIKTEIGKLNVDQQLDLLCALSEGAARAEYTPSHGRVTFSSESLSYFFLTLLDLLQQMGTVSAVDFRAYTRSIQSREI